MTSRTMGTAVRTGALVLGLVASLAAALHAAGPKGDEEVFGLTTVWDVHLDIPADEYAAIEPKGGGFRFPGAPPAPAPTTPADPSREIHKGGSFGVEFPWVRGDVTVDGQTVRGVGLRYKGGGSYMASAGKIKKNFKVDLDHYESDDRVYGMKTLNLNAGAADPTRGREGLGYALFRAAGVHAPRTAYARVTLTVPGKFDRELLGVYTAVEQVDKTFLKDRFGSAKGLLMKPEGMGGVPWKPFDYLGEEWKAYETACDAKRTPTPEEARRIIDFARLVNKADDETFRREVDRYLDVEQFLRFLATTAFTVNLDNIFTGGHNAYIYLDPKTDKFVFIPWDVDLAFGGFPLMGTTEQQLDLSLTKPYSGEVRFVSRLLETPGMRDRYMTLLKELTSTVFSREALLETIDTIEGATRDLLAEEKQATDARNEQPRGGFPGGNMFANTPGLRTFVEKRHESVAAQLAGSRAGYVPAGFGGPGVGGPGGFRIGNMIAPPLLMSFDADRDERLSKDEFAAIARKVYDASERDDAGRLAEKPLAAGIAGLLPKPPEGSPPPPPGMNPGAMLAGAIVKRADADRDNLVTEDELFTAAYALFDQFDEKKTGRLDQKALADLLTELIPRPRFGPPGGPPGGARPERPAP